jgi:RNA-directed DNA polymerase
MVSALRETFGSEALNNTWRSERNRLKSSAYGVDRIGGKQFDAEKSWRIPSISRQRLPTFVPSPLLAIAKPKQTGGERIICVPTIEDRLIQFSILYKIREPLKRKKLLNSVSYGLVAHSQRTVQDARNQATILRQKGACVYKADIQKFFDRIPRARLEAEIRRLVPYPSLHDVLVAFSQVEIGDGFSPDWESIVSAAGITAGLGVRQGMPLSPYFAGMILRDLDLLIEKKGFPVIRYVDDIIGFFGSEQECQDFDGFLRERLSNLNRELGVVGAPGSKTGIYAALESVEFVGMQMHFDKHGRCVLSVSEKTLQKIEARFAEMSQIDKLLQKGITLPHLGSRLEAMSRGYVAAYNGAANMSELKARVRSAADPVVEVVLESIFGPTMKSLGRKERRFLGLQ